MIIFYFILFLQQKNLQKIKLGTKEQNETYRGFINKNRHTRC